ncbi:D-methionine transport system substrate-binding protein [Methylobacterium sp. 174MFSha1.1]|uniref:MetQ/NlpA family ABC transporter substrate-binding protein n=1 Tax=Methylobacterium sp. 174MFSha1.1 TaxID=1502749 RepID=UPI0008EBF720|nr:MetQ/NlpA family ABC transporter substrate-binding protein [Methylobacterium sp. 174MFSha1.1]SFV09010.1 D-methionine transport system substrate-binding protein [Methylobacterium sp. 174MFSha1.1]
MTSILTRRVILGTALAAASIGGVRVSPARAAAPLRIGTTAGPVAQTLDVAATLARAQGQSVEIVEFTDWVTPNEAVATGSLDANLFQHVPFLTSAIKARGYALVPVAPAIILPVGLFSKSLKRLEDVPKGASVAIANDPVNAARGLHLLEKAGLVSLKPGLGDAVTVADVVQNPKGLRILELDAAQLPRVLDDVALAQISFTYLIAAGGDPKTALITDGAGDRHYTLSFVARPNNRDDARLAAFIATYRSPEVKRFLLDRYGGFLEPAW